MGQCYSVFLKAKLKDAAAFVRLTNEYASSHNWSQDYQNKLTGITDIIHFMVGGADGAEVRCEDGWPVFRGDYDASYTWETVLDEWFHAIAPALADGSEIEVYPDEGSWKCVVHDGKVDKTYDEGDEDEEEEV